MWISVSWMVIQGKRRDSFQITDIINLTNHFFGFFFYYSLDSLVSGSYFYKNISFFFSTSNLIGRYMVFSVISAFSNPLYPSSTLRNDRIFPVSSGQNGYRMIVETLMISKVVYRMVSN